MALAIPASKPEFAPVEFKAPDIVDMRCSAPLTILLHESTKAVTLKNPTTATVPNMQHSTIIDMSRIIAITFEKSILNYSQSA
ncbi:MAG: hypothetical protein DK303_001496 [Chloroflexi bacterium]|nr:MAG: hypothetical protein DK303_001496 [Chloroflexota bacterium]